MKKCIAFAALAALGVLFALTLLELALRLTGSTILRVRGREVEKLIPANAIRLLFIGESTTYGLFVRPEEAYPARVGKILETQIEKPVAVFNRGVPSLTSASMLKTLPSKLAVIRPDVVIFLLGANDFHTGYNGLHSFADD